MKWLSAGLTFVNVSTVAGLLLGIIGEGLNGAIAVCALTLGLLAGISAYLVTVDARKTDKSPASFPALERESKRAQRRRQPEVEPAENTARYQHIWLWIVAICFAIFALRSFCWLLYVDGAKLTIQSPNNLGDLSLHITYIRYFSHGVALWPDNPIHAFSKLRYPGGIDLFNGLFDCLHFDLIRSLVWTGLIASLATFYGFYRWSGAFGVAGFLFNGGLAGFQIFRTLQFLDYQGDKTIAWKSIPLAMFVTQRGLLYAIPAGLLLLCHWRAKFFSRSARESGTLETAGILPFWIELSLYASMPLFHVHTFLALSIALVFWLLTEPRTVKKHIFVLLSAAFMPATGIVWLITDHFHAKSILAFQPGWVQSSGDFASSFPRFWLMNFGITLPLILVLIGVLCWRTWRTRSGKRFSLPEPLAFALPAAAIFLFACLVKTAPWEWDNAKLIIWSYFIFLPFLWSELISRWPQSVRYGVCFALFGSGVVTLIGGLAAGRTGFDLADRGDVDAVATVTRQLSIEERFAAYPTYNHPLLLNGRKVVLGYPGHLWTQGFDYQETDDQLSSLMKGAPNWKTIANVLHVRYLFWGAEEKANYAGSGQPWAHASLTVATGSWGTIYDLQQPAVPRTGSQRE